MRGLVVVTLAAIMLSGCAAKPDRDRNIIAGATAGATVGAGVGALIGHATGGPPAGWAGAAIGAASGAVIGAAVGSVKPKGCHYRNTRGETWQVPAMIRAKKQKPVLSATPRFPVTNLANSRNSNKGAIAAA